MTQRQEQTIRRPVLAPRDLGSESLAGLLQRPGRSVLTMLGTVLGIGAFVTILGLTATAGGQISKQFDALSATAVTVEDIGTGTADKSMSFQQDADIRIESLNGVSHAGLYWTLPVRNPTITTNPNIATGSKASGITAYAVDSTAFAAIHPTIKTGRVLNTFVQYRAEHVAVLGQGAATVLGIGRLDAQPAVFINDEPYTIIGIISDTKRLPELMLSVMIPTTTALHAYGEPTDQRAHMLIETKLGAASLIARQAAITLRPDNPRLFKVTAEADPSMLRNSVSHDFNVLFLVLAAVSLVIGAVGIANTTLVAVLERQGEIGLRRALGARPRHVAFQFLSESTVLGGLGGLIGTSLGVGVVISVALIRHWTAILQPWAVLPAPLVGAVVGLTAGIYPALRAAWIEPAEALRR